MTRRLVTAIVVGCLASAGSALARSSGDLVGSVDGTTTQPGGKISPTFNVVTGRFYNASGTFRCTGKGTSTKTYQFWSNGIPRSQQPSFHFDRRFTFKLSQRWLATGQNPSSPSTTREATCR